MIKQQGTALIIGLIMLVVMTLIGVSATSTALMEEKMTGNFRDIEIAYHAADTALRDAEGWLFQQTTNPGAVANGSTMIYTLDALDTSGNASNWWQEQTTSTWWSSNGFDHTDFGGLANSLSNVKTKPNSIIEYKAQYCETCGEIGNVANNDPIFYYRITSRATGGSDESRVLMQSTWSRRW